MYTLYIYIYHVYTMYDYKHMSPLSNFLRGNPCHRCHPFQMSSAGFECGEQHHPCKVLTVHFGYSVKSLLCCYLFVGVIVSLCFTIALWKLCDIPPGGTPRLSAYPPHKRPPNEGR